MTIVDSTWINFNHCQSHVYIRNDTHHINECEYEFENANCDVGHTYGINWQERLKCRNTLSCLDPYAAQNSKYARPPNAIATPNPKGLLPVAHSKWSNHETFTLWNSLCQGAVPMTALWIGSLPPNSFILPTYKLVGLNKVCKWCT